MFMFHASSGKIGYILKKTTPPPTPSLLVEEFLISKEKAIELLTEEHKRRHSDPVQKLFTLADCDEKELESIVSELQRQVVADVMNVEMDSDQFNELFKEFRELRSRFLNDPDVNQLTDYFRYDMSRKGNLQENSIISQQQLESVKLIDLTNFHLNGMNDLSALNEMNENSLPSHIKSLKQLLTEKNQANLPIVLICGSYS